METSTTPTDAVEVTTRVHRGRRRSANVRGGRRVKHEVKVTEEQELRLQLLAGERGITVSRLLLESALASERPTTVGDVHAVVTDLFAIQRYLGALSNNINQLARIANATGQLRPELLRTVAAVRDHLPRISDALLQLRGEQ